MKTEEILKTDIEKAMKNGGLRDTVGDTLLAELKKRGTGNLGLVYWCGVILDHDFAKAFWGEGFLHREASVKTNLWEWQYHLQQMVLKENTIEYIEQFLDERT